MSKQIRVRFAPSPTGYLHIGGLRAALFNWLFARHNHGVFLLRIEDTDLERSRPEYTQAILDSLAWTGIMPDEPPVIQSTRLDAHKRVAQELLNKNFAYRCYCSPEELQKRLGVNAAEGEGYATYDRRCRDIQPTYGYHDQPFVVRFKIPHDRVEIVFDDLIRGPVRFALDQLDDFIILRSDGMPTYNFVVVVDDAAMRISHVIRGEDHISNTPKQILLYQACGFDVPYFAHLPLILGPHGNRLSKRDAATAVTDYKHAGFLPDALCNYLVRLGWSHGDQEIFTQDELIRYFSLDEVGKKSAIFDIKKLEWMNGVYIRQTSPDKLLDYMLAQVNPLLQTVLMNWTHQQIIRLIQLYQDRVTTLKELESELKDLYAGPQGLTSYTTTDTHVAHALALAIERLEHDMVFSHESTAAIVKAVCIQDGLKLGQLAQPIRQVLTGKTASPGIFDLLAVLGKQESLNRLKVFKKLTQ